MLFKEFFQLCKKRNSFPKSSEKNHNNPLESSVPLISKSNELYLNYVDRKKVQ